MEKIKKINKELMKLGGTKDVWKTAEFEEINSALDKIDEMRYVFPKIVETIETDDATEVEEAKLFLKNATSVIINDIKEQLTDFLENYQTG